MVTNPPQPPLGRGLATARANAQPQPGVIARAVSAFSRFGPGGSGSAPDNNSGNSIGVFSQNLTAFASVLKTHTSAIGTFTTKLEGVSNTFSKVGEKFDSATIKFDAIGTKIDSLKSPLDAQKNALLQNTSAIQNLSRELTSAFRENTEALKLLAAAMSTTPAGTPAVAPVVAGAAVNSSTTAQTINAQRQTAQTIVDAIVLANKSTAIVSANQNGTGGAIVPYSPPEKQKWDDKAADQGTGLWEKLKSFLNNARSTSGPKASADDGLNFSGAFGALAGGIASLVKGAIGAVTQVVGRQGQEGYDYKIGQLSRRTLDYRTTDISNYRNRIRHMGDAYGMDQEESFGFAQTAARFSQGANSTSYNTAGTNPQRRTSTDESLRQLQSSGAAAFELGANRSGYVQTLEDLGRAGAVGGANRGQINSGGFAMDPEKFASVIGETLANGRLMDRMDEVIKTLGETAKTISARGGVVNVQGIAEAMASYNRTAQDLGNAQLQERAPTLMQNLGTMYAGKSKDMFSMAAYASEHPELKGANLLNEYQRFTENADPKEQNRLFMKSVSMVTGGTKADGSRYGASDLSEEVRKKLSQGDSYKYSDNAERSLMVARGMSGMGQNDLERQIALSSDFNSKPGGAAQANYTPNAQTMAGLSPGSKIAAQKILLAANTEDFLQGLTQSTMTAMDVKGDTLTNQALAALPGGEKAVLSKARDEFTARSATIRQKTTGIGADGTAVAKYSENESENLVLAKKETEKLIQDMASNKSVAGIKFGLTGANKLEAGEVQHVALDNTKADWESLKSDVQVLSGVVEKVTEVFKSLLGTGDKTINQPVNNVAGQQGSHQTGTPDETNRQLAAGVALFGPAVAVFGVGVLSFLGAVAAFATEIVVLAGVAASIYVASQLFSGTIQKILSALGLGGPGPGEKGGPAGPPPAVPPPGSPGAPQSTWGKILTNPIVKWLTGSGGGGGSGASAGGIPIADADEINPSIPVQPGTGGGGGGGASAGGIPIADSERSASSIPWGTGTGGGGPTTKFLEDPLQWISEAISGSKPIDLIAAQSALDSGSTVSKATSQVVYRGLTGGKAGGWSTYGDMARTNPVGKAIAEGTGSLMNRATEAVANFVDPIGSEARDIGKTLKSAAPELAAEAFTDMDEALKPKVSGALNESLGGSLLRRGSAGTVRGTNEVVKGTTNLVTGLVGKVTQKPISMAARVSQLGKWVGRAGYVVDMALAAGSAPGAITQMAQLVANTEASHRGEPATADDVEAWKAHLETIVGHKERESSVAGWGNFLLRDVLPKAAGITAASVAVGAIEAPAAVALPFTGGASIVAGTLASVVAGAAGYAAGSAATTGLVNTIFGDDPNKLIKDPSGGGGADVDLLDSSPITAEQTFNYNNVAAVTDASGKLVVTPGTARSRTMTVPSSPSPSSRPPTRDGAQKGPTPPVVSYTTVGDATGRGQFYLAQQRAQLESASNNPAVQDEIAARFSRQGAASNRQAATTELQETHADAVAARYTRQGASSAAQASSSVLQPSSAEINNVVAARFSRQGADSNALASGAVDNALAARFSRQGADSSAQASSAAFQPRSADTDPDNALAARFSGQGRNSNAQASSAAYQPLTGVDADNALAARFSRQGADSNAQASTGSLQYNPVSFNNNLPVDASLAERQLREDGGQGWSDTSTVSRPNNTLNVPLGKGLEAYYENWTRDTGQSADVLNGYIMEAAAETGVDPRLLTSLIAKESGFHPGATSSANAQGLTQVLKKNAPNLNLYDPRTSIMVGAKHFAGNLAANGGDVKLALAAYHGGQGMVDGTSPGSGAGFRANNYDPNYFKPTHAYINAILGLANAQGWGGAAKGDFTDTGSGRSQIGTTRVNMQNGTATYTYNPVRPIVSGGSSGNGAAGSAPTVAPQVSQKFKPVQYTASSEPQMLVEGQDYNITDRWHAETMGPGGPRRQHIHTGIDLVGRADRGSLSAAATEAGTVLSVQTLSDDHQGWGNNIWILHKTAEGKEFATHYSHLETGSMTVKPGETVFAGQKLGKVGSTGNSSGPHLDFEYADRINGQLVKSDPEKYLNQISGQAVTTGVTIPAQGQGQVVANGQRPGPGQGSGLLSAANGILNNLGLPSLAQLPGGMEGVDQLLGGAGSAGGLDLNSMLSTLMGSIGQLWASGKSAASQVVSSFTHNFNMTITLVPQNADGSKAPPTTVTAKPVVTVDPDGTNVVTTQVEMVAK